MLDNSDDIIILLIYFYFRAQKINIKIQLRERNSQKKVTPVYIEKCHKQRKKKQKENLC